MAAKKKIGYDPLAWMEEAEAGAGSTKREPKRPGAAAEKRPRKPGPNGKAKLNVSLLEETFAALEPHAENLVDRFYEELFERYPAVRPMFEGVDPEVQRKKLVGALKLVVSSLRKPQSLRKALAELGARHQRYGAEPEHYEAVASTLLDVMQEFAGEAWTEHVHAAWKEALSMVADEMLKAYENMEAGDMATRKKSMEEQLAGQVAEAVMDDMEVLQDVLEHAPVNVMIADAQENIVFLNRRAREVLGDLESELAQYLPGFRADEVVGGSIHRYHKDPEAIKRVLHGLRPGEKRQGEITPGPYVFEHETRALVNRDGERIGYVVQWHDVTEKRKKEEQAQRLQRAVDGAQTAMMTIDRDLVITYVNGETEELMRKNADSLRTLYPGFDPDRLVGTCIDMFHKNPAHQRRLLGDAANLPYETDIQVGPLTFHIRVSAIQDLQGEYVGNTLEWSDVSELRQRELDVARLQSAVEGAQTNLMLCDSDFKITYVNPAVVEMLKKRQDELRKVFPGFDANNLIGQSIDQFHKNPAHQRALLSDPSRLPYRSEIPLLDLVFEVNATAIVDKDGNWMGNMVEWKDLSEQKDAERQIQGLIEGAVAGELDQRIDTANYSGFMKGLGNGVNELMDAVVKPLKEGTRVMQSLSEGDLTQTMEGEFEGEFRVLCDAVNTSITNLKNMVGEIMEAGRNIDSAASEIAQGNTDLSQRTEEQASSLEETASSMEELTGTVKQNADNAGQANQLAAGARTEAEKGGEVATKTVAAMAEINNSSKKIADIIGVIDEIAFQTNLLALNAAVEAARAGEQGRGFAVVAAEVRNLAQRSATAAKEIKGLINDSVEKVEEGTRLVDESGKSLEEIVNSVKKVSDIVAEIAAASQEQSSGIEQVNKAVMQMDEMTQQNAALVEEAAAASESLDEQTNSLRTLMEYFTVDDAEKADESPIAKLKRNQESPAGKPAPASMNRATRANAGEAARPVNRRKQTRPAPSGDEGDEWEEF